jgi:hypothetical protein
MLHRALQVPGQPRAGRVLSLGSERIWKARLGDLWDVDAPSSRLSSPARLILALEQERVLAPVFAQ